MSYIRKQLGENYKNYATVLNEYADVLMNYDENLAIKGKLLEHSNREQPIWLAYYDERKIELKVYVEFFELEIMRVKAKLLKGMETYPRELSDRMKEKYIEGEQAYLDVYEKYLEVKEMYGKFDSIVNSFIQRGYALRNITNRRVAGLEDVTI